MRRALSAIAGLLAAVFVYALLRAGAGIFGAEPNPATLFYAPHTAYYWRSLTSIHAGLMVAVIAWMLASRDEERVLRAIERALVPCVLAVVLQSIFIP